MAFKFFVVPARDFADAEQELNHFVASRKVLSIARQLIDQEMNSFWAICVDYLTATGFSTGGDDTWMFSRVRPTIDLPEP